MLITVLTYKLGITSYVTILKSKVTVAILRELQNVNSKLEVIITILRNKVQSQSLEIVRIASYKVATLRNKFGVLKNKVAILRNKDLNSLLRVIKSKF